MTKIKDNFIFNKPKIQGTFHPKKPNKLRLIIKIIIFIFALLSIWGVISNFIFM